MPDATIVRANSTCEGSATRNVDYYEAFVDSVSSELSEVAPTGRLEIVGSVARGEARPPYSDLDLMLIVRSGDGRALRDQIPQIAARVGGLLTIFVDPFSSQGCLCSVYSGPFKVDWFVAEESDAGRRLVWAGLERPPTDPDGHPWDWIWWIWGKMRTGKSEFAARELSKLWQFLVFRGASAKSFPPTIADPDHDDLVQLVLGTLDHLPSCAVGREVRSAIEADSKLKR